jgi:hypothetical protein
VLNAKAKIVPPRGQPGWASEVLLLDPQGLPVDASQYEGIRLRVRIHKGALSVSANSTEVTNYDYHAAVAHPHIDLIRVLFSFTYALMMGSLVALSLGLFKRFFDKPSKTVHYLSDASYWPYLVHLPIVIWLQIAFAELPFHWVSQTHRHLSHHDPGVSVYV